jgi:hypothetical protein
MDNIDYEKEYKRLKSLLREAYAAYTKDDGSRTEKRQAEVCRILGFSNGRRQAKVEADNLLRIYQARVIDSLRSTTTSEKTSKQTRQETIDDMAKEFGMAAGSLAKTLQRSIKAYRDRRAIVDKRHGHKSLDMWKGLAPPQKQYSPKK